MFRGAILAGLLLAAIPGTVAWAQIVGDAPKSTGEKPRIQPPPALPGARSTQGQAAPPERLPSDLLPNEAMFDGINRGDAAAVREALARGADLNARNVLGLRPIELSVDLGRNDVTFLLLSMRGASSPAGRTVATNGKPAPAVAAPRAAPREPVAAAPQPPRSRQFIAGDAGTPAPQAGFLGFGTPRQ